MPFEKPRILTDRESNIIRGKVLAGHATKAEMLQLIGHFDLMNMKLRSAIESLSACLPPKIYITGTYGDKWSSVEPDDSDEYETIDFKEILGAIAGE